MPESKDPYVGPRSFERDDAGLFFGRDREAAELLSLIIAHPVVLFYSVSGAGKTSLLNAKLAPMLSARSSIILGPARVGGRLTGPMDAAVDNVFVYNTLLTLAGCQDPGADLARLSLEAYLQRQPFVCPPGVNAHRVLILDQFEEVFTMYPERWRDRDGLFEDLGAVLEKDLRLRVVLAMREEYIASLEPYAGTMPERLRARFRLECLRKGPAMLAVERPLQHTDKRFAPGAAAVLVDILLKVQPTPDMGTVETAGEFVEPMQLQLVCQDLWRSLPSDAAIIDEQRIRQLADVDKTLSKYYEFCVKQVVEARLISEGSLRRWFDKVMITAHGTRALVHMGERTTGGLPNAVVELLDKLRLVRPEVRGKEYWYELTHDRFVEPIRQANRTWLEARPGAGRMVFFESRAEQWLSGSKANSFLLSAFEVSEVQQWLRSPEGHEVGVSDAVGEFVEASELAAAQRRTVSGLRRRLRIAIVALAVIATILSVYSVSASRARRRAEDAVWTERGDTATLLSSMPGREFDALASGIRAVAPPFLAQRAVPAGAEKGFRSALAAVGTDTWLRGSPSPVRTVLFSPSDRHALVVSTEAVEAWDAVTGKQLYSKPIESPSGVLRSFVRYSPDGKYIVGRLSSLPQARLRAWNSLTGDDIKEFEDALKADLFVFFGKGDAPMIAVGRDARFRIRSVSSAALLGSLGGTARDIFALAISPDGSRVACSTFGSVVFLWNTRTGNRIALRERRGSPVAELVESLQFTDDSRFLTAVAGPSFRAWEATTGAFVLAESLAEGRDGVLAALERSRMIVGGSSGVDVWDLVARRRIVTREWNSVAGEKTTLAGVGANGWLVYTDAKGDRSSITALNALSGDRRRLAVDLPGVVAELDVSQDLKRVLYVDAQQRARVLQVDRGDAQEPQGSAVYLVACERLAFQREYAVVRDLCSSVNAVIKRGVRPAGE